MENKTPIYQMSVWRTIMEKWMNRNGYDIDKTDGMWAVLAFVQHLEWLHINNHIRLEEELNDK
jgi:hypothetical protein